MNAFIPALVLIACMASPGVAGVAAQHTILVNVQTDSTTYTPGEAVRITITGRTFLNTTLVADVMSSCVFDFQITDSSGREVFIYTKNARCLHDGMMGGVSFPPGQPVTFSAAWNQTDNSGKAVAPGEYQLKASLVGVESQNAVMFTVAAAQPAGSLAYGTLAVAGIAAAIAGAYVAIRRRGSTKGRGEERKPQNVKLCAKCDAELPLDARFCDSCGASQP